MRESIEDIRERVAGARSDDDAADRGQPSTLPRGLSQRSTGGPGILLQINRPRWSLPFVLVFLGGAAFLALISLWFLDWVMMAVTLPIFFGMLGYLWLDRRWRRQIRIDGQRLVINDRLPGPGWGRHVFDLDRIEFTAVTFTEWRGASALEIDGGDKEVTIGYGLSDEALSWLEDSINAALPRADSRPGVQIPVKPAGS